MTTAPLVMPYNAMKGAGIVGAAAAEVQHSRGGHLSAVSPHRNSVNTILAGDGLHSREVSQDIRTQQQTVIIGHLREYRKILGIGSASR